jgi:hypothetical protein
MSLLRPGLLEGRSVAVAGAVPELVAAVMTDLGSRVMTLPVLDEERALEWAKGAAPIDAAVCAAETLVDVDTLWGAVRAVANGALIPAGAGAIVLLGPRPDAAAHAQAVRAALENLARTLSVEWARYGLTATAIAPGSRTGDDDVSTLVAFLCSGAGAYCSGCRFDLDAIG